VFKFAGIILAAVFLAGCATPPAVPPPEVVIETGPVISSPLNWTNPAAAKAFAPQPSKPVAPQPTMQVPPVVSTVTINKPPVTGSNPAPVTTWTSLNRWAAAHNLGAPHRLTGSPVTSYALGSKTA
jgi:hypothetical protein